MIQIVVTPAEAATGHQEDQREQIEVRHEEQDRQMDDAAEVRR